MNKYILDSALKVIKERQKNANNLAYVFMQKAMKNEKFRDNYAKLKQAEIENAKAEVYGQEKQFSVSKLEQEQNEILKNINIKKESLIPHYHCKKCNDTGYKNQEMCSCLKQVINEKLFEQSGLNHTLQRFENSNFDLFDNPNQIKNIYETLKKWCKKDSKYQNIVLTGKTGVGKTHLMECMADELIKQGNIVYFTSAFNFNQSLLKFHTTFDETRISHISTLLDADFLFIDDLGCEPMLKNVTVEGLYNVLSERMEKNKKTIISTNLNLEQIENTYGERIFSRLISKEKSLCIGIENQDIRLKNTK